jgi:hypothetical protein
VRPMRLAILVAAVALSIGAGAGAISGKQRVVIQWKGARGFVLTPLTSGRLKGDTGTATFCCWKSRVVIRDGLKVEIGDPKMTFSGSAGPSWQATGWSSSTSKVATRCSAVRGKSSAARGLRPAVGSGRIAGIVLPNGTTKWQREGFLGSN